MQEGLKEQRKFTKKIQQSGKFPETTFALISKRRDKPNSIESMKLIGEVRGRDVIIVDDIVDTAGTLCKAAEALKTNGAKSVRAFITHGILSGEAVKKIRNSQLDHLYVSNSIVHKIEDHKIEFIDIAKTFSQVLYAITHRSSVDVINSGVDI
jgi:ribose-phosphate pyrophosphokinase